MQNVSTYGLLLRANLRIPQKGFDKPRILKGITKSVPNYSKN